MEIFIILAFIVALILILSRKPDQFSHVHHAENKSLKPGASPSDLRRVRVKYVIDGDTVIVSEIFSETKLRLYAIDCPESGQPWGNTAKAGLIKMIGHRHAHIETHGLDKYGRTLATIHIQRGPEWINVNESMVMLGHAWVMRKYYGQLGKDRQSQLDKLEKWAKTKRAGLWKANHPVPPWQWRKRSQATAGRPA